MFKVLYRCNRTIERHTNSPPSCRNHAQTTWRKSPSEVFAPFTPQILTKSAGLSAFSPAIYARAWNPNSQASAGSLEQEPAQSSLQRPRRRCDRDRP